MQNDPADAGEVNKDYGTTGADQGPGSTWGPRLRFSRRVALCACAVSVLLPVSTARAQTGDALPFVPLPTSAECTTGERREVDISVTGTPELVITTRDRTARHADRRLKARHLGRSARRFPEPSLPVGNVVDTTGNRYVAARTRRGDAIYRISGDARPRVHVLQVTSGARDGTGEAAWLPILHTDLRFLDRATLVSNATTWARTADLVVDNDTLYVAIPDEHRVLAISLHEGSDRWGRDRAEVWNFVKAGVNAPWAFAPPTSEDSFTFPTHLSVDRDGFLYITEDVEGDTGLKDRGDDTWVAAPASESHAASGGVARFATLEDCDARVTGLELDPGGTIYLRIARSRYFFGLVLKN